MPSKDIQKYSAQKDAVIHLQPVAWIGFKPILNINSLAYQLKM